MIPCKMPDDSLALLEETIELLDKAQQNSAKLLDAGTGTDNPSSYLQLALDMESLRNKVASLRDRMLE